MSINKPRYTVSNSQSSDGGIMVDANGDQAASVYSRTDSFREAVADAVQLVVVQEQPPGCVTVVDEVHGLCFTLDPEDLELGTAALRCVVDGGLCVHPTTFPLADLIASAK